MSAIYIAMIDDETGDSAGRDQMLAQLPTLPHYGEPVGKTTAILRDAFNAKPAGMPKLAAIDGIAKGLDEHSQMMIFAMTGRYLLDHGYKTEAMEYFKRCMTAKAYYAERLWIDEESQRVGMKSWEVDPWRPRMW